MVDETSIPTLGTEETPAAAVPGPDDGALAALQQQLAEMTADRDRASEACGTVQAERDSLAQQLATLEAVYAEVAGQRDDLTAKLAAATAEAKVTKGPKVAKARAAGPMKPGDFDPEGLLERLQGGGFTVVCSDGKRELTGIAPLVISGDAWTRVPAGVMLREAVTIKPDSAIDLGGFALFDDAGKQVAWCALMRPQRVAGGQEMKLDRQIVF